MPIVNRFADFHDEMARWRQDIHSHPETSFEEVRTSDFVASKLTEWGIEHHRGLAKTGIVGVIHGKGGPGGKAIALRADMDALNMTEETGLPYASTIPGKFHGCGHDGHTTMLLGAARYLAETRNFEGTVYLIFQPAEEGGGGARVMMNEGLFDRFPVETVWALHNWPDMPAGTIAVGAGPQMAAADGFKIVIKGKGAHAAKPHYGVDPVLVGAQTILALQTLVSRSTNALESAVVSATRINADQARNVIPDTVTVEGTVRTYKAEVRDRIVEGMRAIAEGTAAAYGGQADFTYIYGCPATTNTAAEAEIAAAAAAEVVGVENVLRDHEPTMGAEDFAFMLEAKPGAYIFVGGGTGQDDFMVHHPKYNFNDAILPIGSSYFCKLVEKALAA